MCGIIGVVTSCGNAAAEAYGALKRLEYRGYDSAGISVKVEGKIVTVKHSGRVQTLEGEVGALCGRVAIGHTRWATHGLPTDANAHPHNFMGFSLVHNGIIENFMELKEELTLRGESFCSETDSEVIVRLVAANYSGDLLSAVAAAVKRLKGSFALAIMGEDFDGIIAVKYKSPVVIGFAEDGVYLSSDVPALPPCVHSVSIPEDGDIIKISAKGARYFDFDLNLQKRVKKAISLGQLSEDMGNFAHFMLKEIHENARTVRATADSFVCGVNVRKLIKLIKNCDRIIVTGCGTAYNAGLAAKRYFEKAGDCYVEIASELRYSDMAITPSTLVLAVTQSGETADTVEAVKALKRKGASAVAVTNCGYSAITRVADMVVPVCAGAEICVAATKSYLGQLAALYLLAKGSSAAQSLYEVCDKIDEVISSDRSEKIAAMCAGSSAVFFLGRGIDYAVAVEASLKLKEVSYVFSDGYPAGELKHGTLALIDERTLSVFIICDEKLCDKCINAVEQVHSRKGKVAVVTTLGEVAAKLEEIAEVWLLPKVTAELSPFLSATALQLVAYRTAVLCGRDPDKPRNLAKSVTVE